MIKLYHSKSTCSLTVKMILDAVGAEYEVAPISLADKENLSPEYLAINPLGKVPALEVDGHVLVEGGAILSYIAARHPEAELMPTPGSIEHGEALRWLFTVYGTIHPAFSRMFAPSKYGSNEKDVSSKAREELHKLFKLVNEQLESNEFLAGPTPTLADYHLFVLVYWEKFVGLNLTEVFPSLIKHREKMKSLPFVAASAKSEFDD